MTDKQLDFGDAVNKGLSDYEDYVADANLEESLNSLEQLFLIRERVMLLIEVIKIDILDNHIEKKVDE